MSHLERQRWCEEISSINERINRMSGESDSGSTTGGGIGPGEVPPDVDMPPDVL